MPSDPLNEHTHLTLAFVDVCGSTRLYEKIGDDAAQRRIGGMLDALRTAAQQNQGRVVKEIGDESMIAFPRVGDAIAFARGLPGLQLAQDLRCKTGIHSGEVIVRAQDVFGDAVNTAARIAALATPGQVLLSQTSIDELDEPARPTVRKLPPLAVHGKREALRLVELAEDRDADYTQMIDDRQLAAVHNRLNTRLHLQWDGGHLEVGPHDDGITLGREPGNAIALPLPQVSRVHARIEFHTSHWLLHDQSTNGTQIQEEGSRPLLLRRQQQRLLHAGTLDLAASHPGASVRYRVVEGG